MEQHYHFELITKAIHYIRSHYEQQPSLEEMAQSVHLSKYHFQRLFQKWVGLSPKQFLQFITLESAKARLQAGKTTLDTAYQVGLSGNGRLHNLFLKVEACTPVDFKKRGAGLDIQYGRINTPFGQALVAETTLGICYLAFLDNEPAMATVQAAFPAANLHQGLGPNGKLVKKFFQNWKTPAQKIALDLKGSPFQIQVWKALINIPSAQLLSYGDIARQIGRPGASRAVGTAIGQNPIAYLIPCHRVILQSGEMGGYRWGTDRKLAINGFEFAKTST